MLTEKAEEIMEGLWVEIVENKKETVDMSILKDDEDFRFLVAEQYLVSTGNIVKLTEKGYLEARSCIRRHRLAERLMTDLLYCSNTQAHETGCKFEHLLHKGLEENVCTLLGHPTTCPHGKPIPEGDCCKALKRDSGQLLMPLTDLAAGKKAKIAYLQTKDFESMQKIIAIGALPNTSIVMVQKYPSYVFKIAKSQFAIDQELAEQIYVRSVS